MEDKPALVIDNGSSMIRAGYAGEEFPFTRFPTVIGYAHNAQIVRSFNDYLFGDDALAKYDSFNLSYPIERGIVNNWDDMELIWQHTLNARLATNPAEHPVMLTEPPLNPSANREKMTQIMFENFNVPSMYAADQAVLSMYSSGPVTGVVIESGAGITYVVPVFEGHAIRHAIMRLDIAGQDLSDYLTRLLVQGGYQFDGTPTARAKIEEIKKTRCAVALDFEEGQQQIAVNNQLGNTHMVLHGSEVHPGDAFIRCPEVMFQPSLLGLETAGLHELVNNAILKCDKDLHNALYRNIVLSGGNTFLQGMKDRLQKELRALVPNNIRPNVRAPVEHYLSAWIGGSILGSLSTMEQKWITKAEYDEYGPTIVNTKCV